MECGGDEHESAPRNVANRCSVSKVVLPTSGLSLQSQTFS